MQPHLKKCFEGIAQLTFTPQLIIVGMESVEGEKVGFSTSLNPAEANGMVEKWLLQVRPAPAPEPEPEPEPETQTQTQTQTQTLTLTLTLPLTLALPLPLPLTLTLARTATRNPRWRAR